MDAAPSTTETVTSVGTSRGGVSNSSFWISVDVAIDKARSAARFKRPTRAFQDTLAGGGEGLRVLALTGAVAVEGGVPIVIEGKIVGAIGVSGGTSPQDGQCARAGAGAATADQ